MRFVPSSFNNKILRKAGIDRASQFRLNGSMKPIQPGAHMNTCTFCQILDGQLPASFVYRDENCTAFMDIHPINPGHVLVVPNEHCERVSQLRDQQSSHLLTLGKNILRAIERSSLKCEGANLFISDGEVAGQEVPHVHLHIVPRFAGDKQGKGFSHAQMKREELDLIAKELRGFL